MRRIGRVARALVGTVAVIYLALCLLLAVFQRKFIYFPSASVNSTPKDYAAAYDEFWIPAADGGRLQAWWIPSSVQRAPTLLYFHGNGANIGANAAQAVRLSRACCNVLIFDYRGYGRSSGPFPAEKRLYEDAESAWKYLVETRRVPSAEIVLYGHSLGSGVAIEMAQRHSDIAGLIVENALTSVVDRGTADPIYRVFPIRLLARERFDSIHKIRSVHSPILIIRGGADMVIPPAMSLRLYKAAPGPKRLVTIAGGGHDNTAAVGGMEYAEAVRGFVNGLRSPQTANR